MVLRTMAPAHAVLAMLVAALAASGATAAAPHALTVSDACHWDGFDAAVERFSRVIQFKTVSDASSPNHALDPREFTRLDAFLRESYPSVFEALEVEKVGVDGLSYLFTWRGSDPALRPVLLISHLDVVPVPQASEKDWTHPPFSGAVADGFVWGRGTMDVKVSAVAILEAAAALLAQGWSPRRGLLFAFGQDEEVGGAHGAAETAKLLASRGVEVEVIWDEGSPIVMDGIKPFTSRPVALVSTAEKGYQSVTVSITSQGGHSSMPPIDGSSVGDVMGRILTRISTAQPTPRLVAPVTDMLAGAAEFAPAWLAALLAAIGRVPGVDLFVARLMATSSAQAASLTRTTLAVTGVTAGVADNVLPQQGSLRVNARLLQGDTPQGLLAYLTRIIGPGDMARVSLELAPPGASSPPSPVSPASGPHYALLKQVIQEFWHVDGVPVAVLPFLLPGMTDSRKYADVSRHGTLRFCALGQSRAEDVPRVHGTNERVAVHQFRGLLCTTRAVMARFGGMGPEEAGGGGGGGGGDGKDEL
ncbi:MAG: hypothetical protein J3K34DRAFT_525282 [Monoraphidium minutum]|nr:MAG: hypothetical protein J3K34DRAFT_525282 [Monoraphidium minutum]